VFLRALFNVLNLDLAGEELVVGVEGDATFAGARSGFNGLDYYRQRESYP
jgi:hypothetical protein